MAYLSSIYRLPLRFFARSQLDTIETKHVYFFFFFFLPCLCLCTSSSFHSVFLFHNIGARLFVLLLFFFVSEDQFLLQCNKYLSLDQIKWLLCDAIVVVAECPGFGCCCCRLVFLCRLFHAHTPSTQSPVFHTFEHLHALAFKIDSKIFVLFCFLYILHMNITFESFFRRLCYFFSSIFVDVHECMCVYFGVVDVFAVISVVAAGSFFRRLLIL